MLVRGYAVDDVKRQLAKQHRRADQRGSDRPVAAVQLAGRFKPRYDQREDAGRKHDAGRKAEEDVLRSGRDRLQEEDRERPEVVA